MDYTQCVWTVLGSRNSYEGMGCVMMAAKDRCLKPEQRAATISFAPWDREVGSFHAGRIFFSINQCTGAVTNSHDTVTVKKYTA